jgi:GT2 family glycosyltransferase
MYAEDLDLCRKSVQAGFQNLYIPEARIIHYGGKSSVRRRAVVMKWRSILQYVAKHRGASYQLAFRLVMASSAVLRLALLLPLLAVARGARRNSVRGALLKWWLVLGTMITPLERKPAAERLATEGAHGR